MVLILPTSFVPIAFLTVPMFSIFLSLRNMAPWNRKEIVSCLSSSLFYALHIDNFSCISDSFRSSSSPALAG